MSELFTQQQHNLVTQMAQKRDRSNPLREGLRTGLAGTRKEESVSQSGRESLILTPVKDRSRGDRQGSPILSSSPPLISAFLFILYLSTPSPVYAHTLAQQPFPYHLTQPHLDRGRLKTTP
jgi:hypothetical protein